jgi:hypothetical protein
MGDGVRALTFVAALVLLVLAGAAALLAADARSWRDTLRSDDVVLASSPSSATYAARTRVPFSLAERLLGVRDDSATRRAIALFETTAGAPIDRGNALQSGATLARAEAALAAIARGSDRRRASQAETLLGILVFTAVGPNANPFETQRAGPSPDQVAEAVLDFQNAVRDDPDNATAKYNLELVVRSLAAKGVRVGSSQQSGAGSTGRRGAGGGVPGQGY